LEFGNFEIFIAAILMLQKYVTVPSRSFGEARRNKSLIDILLLITKK